MNKRVSFCFAVKTTIEKQRLHQSETGSVIDNSLVMWKQYENMKKTSVLYIIIYLFSRTVTVYLDITYGDPCIKVELMLRCKANTSLLVQWNCSLIVRICDVFVLSYSLSVWQCWADVSSLTMWSLIMWNPFEPIIPSTCSELYTNVIDFIHF